MIHHAYCPARLTPGYGDCDCQLHAIREQTYELARFNENWARKQEFEDQVRALTAELEALRAERR